MEGNLSKCEIDFYRLLVRCESLNSDSSRVMPWRIKAYITTLRNQYLELKKKPSSLNIQECGRRLEDLQSSFQLSETSREVIIPGKLASSKIIDDFTTEKNKEYQLQIETEIRQRLLHSKNESSSLNPESEQLSQEETERIVQNNRKIQEGQINQLVGLVKDLKESAKDANVIVRHDNETLVETNTIASRNIDHLTVQKKRLDEAVSKSGTLWLWLLIGFVVALFIGMIVFMKIFHKRF